MRKLVFVLVLATFGGLTGCGTKNPAAVTAPTNPLLKVSTAIKNVQLTNKELAASVIKANAAHLLSDKTTGTILQVALKISQGGDEAAAVVQNLSSLPAGTKVTLWSVLKPVSEAVNDALATGLISITDQNTKTSIQGLLTTIQASLAVVQVQTSN